MGEMMRQISFKDLIQWPLVEYKTKGSVYGLKKDKFYKNNSGTSIEMFGQKISTPVGPAAGPATQLAQNLIISYLAGSRYMELKTVQEMDGEDMRNAIARPCIDASDECYNCEWSTELTVVEAAEEYTKGWIATHVLAKEFGISDHCDFVYNISAGYSYDGIASKKIDTFINNMMDASATDTWKEAIAYLEANLDQFEHFTKADLDKISPAVAPSMTLSTLHGCPPEEIEKISMHLLTVKKLHTYIKCNPTLLGYEYARKTLDDLGYNYISFTDHHFNNDLQYEDAVKMITRLLDVSKKEGLEFGVKITNTFPVLNDQGRLPSEEMYMAGRSLYPLSVSAANLLSQEFKGKLPISYSGGADAFNIKGLIEVGIQPITVATTILKPGGYGRIHQLATIVEGELKGKFESVDTEKLAELTGRAIKDPNHHKDYKVSSSVKTATTLPLFDCYKAPCKNGGCPINQQIPEYVNLVEQGKLAEAFEIIAIDNALPAVTGTICDHNCQNKCTRNDYDQPVAIRNAKLTAVNAAQEAYIKQIKVSDLKTDAKVAVVGAGPAGIAVSNFLRRNGMDVTVLERNKKPYGIVEYVIPSFRVADATLKLDFDMAKAAGVNFKFGVDEDYSVVDLQKEYDYVVLATGAWKEGITPVKEGGEHIIDALDFLKESKEKNLKMDLGKRVAVIGAGDVAMDCARAASRTDGVEESVIVYRRTREFMPAIAEEIRLALADGVKIMELMAPVSYDGTSLTVEVQELTEERDDSGRKLMKGTGKIETLEFDTVIGAVGARVDTTLFDKNGIALNNWNMPVVTTACETNIPNVYIGGDCKAGAQTIVKAIADAKAISKDILAKAGLAHDFVKVGVPQPEAQIYARKGVMKNAAQKDRCLTCDQICEVCTDVCPNRANVAITIHEDEFTTKHQILHVDGMCNECGNCGTFCPHTGNPYLDKFTLYWTEHDFKDSTNRGFLPVGEDSFKVRLENMEIVEYKMGQEGVIPTEMAKMIATVMNDYKFLILENIAE